MSENKSFTTGQQVSCRSACDHDTVWTFEVVKRTAKFVTLRDVCSDETVRVGVLTSNGAEWCKPFGTFSMCPVLRVA
jgi:hypothetical protein